MAVADVFDSLGSARSYKLPWPIDEIKDLLITEKGKKFEPQLVDLLMENLDEFCDIREQYPDK